MFRYTFLDDGIMSGYFFFELGQQALGSVRFCAKTTIVPDKIAQVLLHRGALQLRVKMRIQTSELFFKTEKHLPDVQWYV